MLRTITSLGDFLSLSGSQFVFRPYTLERAVSFFISNFKGKVLYAVKTNPELCVLRELYTTGIRNFDVASLKEVALIKGLFPHAGVYFMHPVKPRHAIREAYFDYGVRHFSLDSEEELEKILQETGKARDLHLYVRLSIPNSFAEISLSGKFGVSAEKATDLLTKVVSVAEGVGVSFHVGSQCMHQDAYRIAIAMVTDIIKKSSISLDYFNVGGGFPSIYPGMAPPPLSCYLDVIHEEFSRVPGCERMQLLSEPGRALVAESMSLIVRVDLRKGGFLYINDGTYGSLFDAGFPGFIFPMQRLGQKQDSSLVPFSFYGPTCDSLDFMKGPFYLPEDMAEGDLIEIGQLGAYGRAIATDFNGFASEKNIWRVSDEPLMSMYNTWTVPRMNADELVA